MLHRLDQSALLAAWRRMGRLVHDLWIAQPRAYLSSQGSVVLPSRGLPPRSPAADLPAHSLENEDATRRSRLVGKSFE